jgi:hypothetical protein
MMIPKFKTSDLDEMKAVCRPLGDGAPMTSTDPYPDSDIPSQRLDRRDQGMDDEIRELQGEGRAEITGMAIR